jgi:isochorismate synthase
MIETLVGAEKAHGRALRAGIRKARSRGEPVIVSWTEAVPFTSPLDLYLRGRRLDSRTFYWERPDDRFALVGIGVARSLVNYGEVRFDEVARAWRALVDGALIENGSSGAVGTGPVAVGGFSFDPLRPPTALWDGFPSGRLNLPRYLFTSGDDSCWLTVNTVVNSTSHPEAEADRLAADLQLLRTTRPRELGWNGAQSSKLKDTQRVPGSRTPRGYPAQRHPEGTRLRAHGSSLRSAESWKTLVVTAREAIRQGQIEKIVLARAVRAVNPSVCDPAVALSRLREELPKPMAGYPGCSLFAVSNQGATFLGATPERLVRLQNGTVQVDCLAGTTGRGQTEDEDGRLGAELLENPKERSEHEVVLRMLEARLAARCIDLRIPPEPALVKLRNVQHLYTPIAGSLLNGHSILSMVEELHPSPAVGGFPVDVAQRFIREREELDRGWYAGPIGWMNRSGEGEFAVAIRSALIRGSEATLFAGCGIMADSDPDSEYEESCLKLRSMLGILGGLPG